MPCRCATVCRQNPLSAMRELISSEDQVKSGVTWGRSRSGLGRSEMTKLSGRKLIVVPALASYIRAFLRGTEHLADNAYGLAVASDSMAGVHKHQVSPSWSTPLYYPTIRLKLSSSGCPHSKPEQAFAGLFQQSAGPLRCQTYHRFDPLRLYTFSDVSTRLPMMPNLYLYCLEGRHICNFSRLYIQSGC